jgi:hypothetical protein
MYTGGLHVVRTRIPAHIEVVLNLKVDAVCYGCCSIGQVEPVGGSQLISPLEIGLDAKKCLDFVAPGPLAGRLVHSGWQLSVWIVFHVRSTGRALY